MMWAPDGCTDTSDPENFRSKTFWTFQTSDLGHFGMSEMSQHFSNGAKVSFGHFGTILAGWIP